MTHVGGLRRGMVRRAVRCSRWLAAAVWALQAAGAAPEDAPPLLPPAPRGARDSARSLYAARTSGDGRFHCLDGSSAAGLPQGAVNDDYCDCADGSDEPGTAACAGRRGAALHCPNQWPGEFVLRRRSWRLARDLPSQFVGDGVCDCCDGADEPAGRCANTCQAEARRMLAANQEADSRREDALAKRAQLARKGTTEMAAQRARLERDTAELERMRAALGSSPTAAEAAAVEKLAKRTATVSRMLSFDYGEDNRFLLLHFQCYNITRGKFLYRLCPFRKVEQWEGRESKLCGTFEGWERGDYGAWGSASSDAAGGLQTMLYGGGLPCGDRPRSARVRVACGADSRILEATEPSECTYALTLETPAACTEDF